jgi:large subunit ribosomal protein L9
VGESHVDLTIKTGENGKVFGSISAKEIAEAAKKQLGFELDKKKIQLGSAIKELGTHKVTVKLHPQVSAELTVNVTEEK